MNNIAIQADKLTRKFGKFTAVDDISFSLPYGSIFGFLGANGAGKSTTIRMLCGILAPTSGTGKVAGFDVQTQSEQIKAAIGYVSQRFSLYSDLTVMENLLFFGRIYGLVNSVLKQRIQEVLLLTGLDKYHDRLAGELSGGWKQKLGIANSFLHNPKIIFLDEPTAGIDPIARRSIWELLYQLADQGVSLFVTTHYMEEAERCNTIAFISQGKVFKMGTPSQLKHEISDQLLQVECNPLLKASQAFSKLEGVMGLTVYGTTLNINVRNLEQAKVLIEQAAKRENINITSMRPIPASLEDVFSLLDIEKES